MNSDLKLGEPHPASDSAMAYIQSIPKRDLYRWLESFSSCAIEGNRIGEICSETLRRLLYGESVSDRYLLGLAWTLKELEKLKDDTKKESDDERADG